MCAAYFVQAYKAKGTRLVGQATERFGYADEAIAAAKRLSPWRAGTVVFRQEIHDSGASRSRPALMAVYGRVLEGWLAAERLAVQGAACGLR